MGKRGEKSCPLCGAAIALTGSDGLCPGCLLASVLDPSLGEPPEDEEPALGECGGYILEREIGRGGSGVVFLARLPSIERPFALKMPAARFAGPDEIRRFRIEVESVAGLDHPNIIPLHSAGEEDGRPYFVMKYAGGGSLQSLLKSRGGVVTGSVRPDDVACMVKVARAVHFAHERGVLHRDLKPANILLDSANEPMVSDFGLARMLHVPSQNTLTGSAVGTPAYMSPEQAAGATVTTATDVYSLGAVLFQLLTGHPPFEEGTPLETLRKLATEDPVDPRSWVPDLDRDLATVCLKCLHRDPMRRYHSAAGFADDLERWLNGEPVLARRAGLGERLVKWGRRHPALAALTVSTGIAAITVISLLIGGSEMLRRERNEARKLEEQARKSAVRANETAEAFRQNAYAADIYLANRAINDGQIGVARKMLERHLPAKGEKDLRGYEWHALTELCRGTEAKVFREHQAAIPAVAFDPTGKWLASAGRNGTVVVREMPEGKVILSLPRDDAPANVAEIPLLASLASRSPEVTSRILSLDLNPDEMRMRARPSRLGELNAIAWSPDGKMIATSSWGAYVRLWKMPEGELIGFLPMMSVSQLAFSDDGTMLVSLENFEHRRDLRIHRIEDLVPLRTIKDVQSGFSIAQGKLAVALGTGPGMQISDLKSGTVLDSWGIGIGVAKLAFSNDTRSIVALDVSRQKWIIWESASGRKLHEQDVPAGVLNDIAFSSDGNLIVTAGTSQSLYLSFPDDHKSPSRLVGHEDEILSLAISPDSRWIASGSNDQTLRLWDTRNPAKIQKPVFPADWQVVETAPDARSWLAESGSGDVFLCHLDGRWTALPASEKHHALGFGDSGETFITWRKSDREAVFEWWNSSSMSLVEQRSIRIDFKDPWLLKCEPGGRHCAVTARQSPVRILDLKSGATVHEFVYPGSPVARMGFSPDCRNLFVFAWPRQIRMAAIGGKWSNPWNLSEGTVGPIVFSRDGRWIASGGNDNTVSIREVPTGRLIRELVGHRSQITSLAFTPDNRTLASAANDETLRLWHTETWRDLGILSSGTLHGHIQFDENGQSLMVIPWNAAPFVIPEARK